jgi:predicted peptidase
MVHFLTTIVIVVVALLFLVSPLVGRDAPLNPEVLNARAERVRPLLEETLKRFEKRTFFTEKGAAIPYRFFEPENREKDKVYPLVVYLHGSGGRGSDNIKQVSGGNIWGARIWLLPENQKKFPSFVIAPQSSITDFEWSKEELTALKTLLDQIIQKLNIDKNRIYVTGQSMGGYGTWLILTTYPEFFAAGVPVCGGGQPGEAGSIVKNNVGIWAFHGGNDPAVPVEKSREMIEAIKEAGGKPLYTEYPGVGHASYKGAYTEKGLLPWLFAQKRTVSVDNGKEPNK